MIALLALVVVSISAAATAKAGDKLTREKANEIHGLIEANDPQHVSRLEELLVSSLPGSLLVREGDWGGRIPICKAAYCGNLGAVELLLRLGANVEGEGEEGTPLQDAAMMGHAEIVSFLIARGASVDAKDVAKWTAFLSATLGGHARCAQILLDAGADPNPRLLGRTLLHLAADRGSRELFDLLFERAECEVSAKDSEGRTALEIAAWSGNADAIAALGAHGADPHQGTVDRQSLLALAASSGNAAAIRALLELGAALDSESVGPPLHLAARRGSAEAVEAILAAPGAPPIDDVREHGWTPLHEAAAHGGSALEWLLAQPGVRVDRQTKTGRSALHFAALRGDLRAVQALLDHGADPELQDGLGRKAAAYLDRRQRAVERWWTRAEEDVPLEDADLATIALEDEGNSTVIYERRYCPGRTACRSQLLVWSDGLVVFTTYDEAVRVGRLSPERVAFFLEELTEAGFSQVPRLGLTGSPCGGRTTLKASLGGKTLVLTMSGTFLDHPKHTPATRLLADTWQLVRRIEADLLPDESATLDSYLLEQDLRGLSRGRFVPGRPARRR